MSFNYYKSNKWKRIYTHKLQGTQFPNSGQVSLLSKELGEGNPRSMGTEYIHRISNLIHTIAM